MSDIPVPTGPKKRTDIEQTALFVTGFLGIEMLKGIRFPEDFQHEYDEMDKESQKEWYELNFQALLRDANMGAADFLGRQLKDTELDFIKKRIVIFFKHVGIECSQE